MLINRLLKVISAIYILQRLEEIDYSQGLLPKDQIQIKKYIFFSFIFYLIISITLQIIFSAKG